MARGRKYAALPDIDTAPDIFESTENGATDGGPTQSPTSDISSMPDEELVATEHEAQSPKRSRIDRHTNQLSDARHRFSRSRVDAREVDFSDRINGERRSYKVTLHKKQRRKRREDGIYEDEYAYSSEEDQPETLEQRITRLQREIEEVKIESEDRAQNGGTIQTAYTNGEDSIATEQLTNQIGKLGSLLKSVQAQQRSAALHKGVTDTHESHSDPKREEKETHVKSHESAPNSLTPQPIIENAPAEQVERVLSKAADLESRLNQLEETLGSTTVPFFSQSQSRSDDRTNKNVLGSISMLESQFSSIASTTVPALGSMNNQIKQLTESASRLEEARKSAREAQETILAKSPGRPISSGTPQPPSGPPDLPEDAEETAMIDKLFSMLSTVEILSPLLPSVLDRLKSLRVLHAEAATVSENLSTLEKNQARLDDELKTWRQGIERAEEAMNHAEATTKGNTETVENWVKDLEERFDKL